MNYFKENEFRQMVRQKEQELDVLLEKTFVEETEEEFKVRVAKNKIRMVMRNSVSDEYARYILEHKSAETESTFMDEVIEDVICSSAWDEEGCYNDDDIRLSIGRVLMERLGVEV